MTDSKLRLLAGDGDFKKIDYTLDGLLHGIEQGDIGLPDIQRPFVGSARTNHFTDRTNAREIAATTIKARAELLDEKATKAGSRDARIRLTFTQPAWLRKPSLT